MIQVIQTVWRYLFIVAVLGILGNAIAWQFSSNDWNDLSMMIWMPAGAVLLYIATRLLNPKNRAWFYLLQIIVITLPQFPIGATLFERDIMSNVISFVGPLAIISIFVYFNIYIAFLVPQKPPIWYFLIGPIGMTIMIVYHGEDHEFLVATLLVVVLNSIVLALRHHRMKKEM